MFGWIRELFYSQENTEIKRTQTSKDSITKEKDSALMKKEKKKRKHQENWGMNLRSYSPTMVKDLV